MKFETKVLFPLIVATALSAQESWFTSFVYTNQFEALTTRDVTANGSFGGGYLSSMELQKGGNADRTHDLKGIRIGKMYDSWRFYADYGQFQYAKSASDPYDKNVDGWMLTANADYLYNLPVFNPASLFIGGSLTVAGAKPEGMDSNPAPGAGVQAGMIIDAYKSENYKISFEFGYRYLWLNIKSKQTITDPATTAGVQYLISQQDPTANVNSILLDAKTTALKSPYFSVNIAF
jgi:hypothetical protein